MNLLGDNPLRALRERIGAALGVFAFSVLCCVIGVIMTFVLAPGQALEANRISRLPLMDAGTVDAASVGDVILITGILNGQPTSVSDFIAYGGERWTVRISSGVDDDSPSDPTGSWTNVPSVVPELTLNMNGGSVAVHTAKNVRVYGELHDLEIPAEGTITAKYNGKPVTDGTVRYHGFEDGDLATVYGKKSVNGGVDPEQLFAGDRTAFEESQHQATTGFLYSGICMFILAPLILVGGLFAVVFKRR